MLHTLKNKNTVKQRQRPCRATNFRKRRSVSGQFMAENFIKQYKHLTNPVLGFSSVLDRTETNMLSSDVTSLHLMGPHSR